MERRDPRPERPDERPRSRAQRPLRPGELKPVRGGIDTVPLPEMPTLWFRIKATAWLAPRA